MRYLLSRSEHVNEGIPLSNTASTISIIVSLVALMGLQTFWIARSLDALRNEMTTRLDSIDRRLDRIEARLDQHNERIARLEEKVHP